MVLLPRSHFQPEGFPVDRSEKDTSSGAQPSVGVALKLAVICAFRGKANDTKKANMQIGLGNRLLIVDKDYGLTICM